MNSKLRLTTHNFKSINLRDTIWNQYTGKIWVLMEPHLPANIKIKLSSITKAVIIMFSMLSWKLGPFAGGKAAGALHSPPTTT